MEDDDKGSDEDAGDKKPNEDNSVSEEETEDTANDAKHVTDGSQQHKEIGGFTVIGEVLEKRTEKVCVYSIHIQ